MANLIVPTAKQYILEGSLDWVNDTIKVALFNSYTYDATDETIADAVAGGGANIIESDALATKTNVNGVCKADNIVITNVPDTSGNVTQIVIFKDGATDADKVILIYIDEGYGLPMTPVNEDVSVFWDLTNGVFAL